MAKKENLDNPILQLLDKDNNDPITLYDENEKPVEFEQIAIIPHKEKLFAILKPLHPMEGVADDEAIVFRFEEDDNSDDQMLVMEESDTTIDEVFDIYNKLLNEKGVKTDAE